MKPCKKGASCKSDAVLKYRSVLKWHSVLMWHSVLKYRTVLKWHSFQKCRFVLKCLSVQKWRSVLKWRCAILTCCRFQLNSGTLTSDQGTTAFEQTIASRVRTEDLNKWCSVSTLEFSSAFPEYVRNGKLNVLKCNIYLPVRLQKETKKVRKFGPKVEENSKRAQ